MTENRRYINYIDDTVISTLEDTMGSIPELGSFSGGDREPSPFLSLAFHSKRQRRFHGKICAHTVFLLYKYDQ